MGKDFSDMEVKEIQKSNEELPVNLSLLYFCIMGFIVDADWNMWRMLFLSDPPMIPLISEDRVWQSCIFLLFLIPLLQWILESRSEKIHGEGYVKVKQRIEQAKREKERREKERRRREDYFETLRVLYSINSSSDDDDSEDRRMCRECHFRPVMGGRNKWRQTTCEQCLLEWDGDD